MGIGGLRVVSGLQAVGARLKGRGRVRLVRRHV